MFIASSIIGAVLGATGGGLVQSPLLGAALALVGGSAGAAIIGHFSRSRSGEGSAAAARDMTSAVGHLVDASEQITMPLQRRIVDLATDVANLTTRLADARIEVHETRKEAAEYLMDLERARLEIESLRVQVGQSPDRRDP